MHEGVLHPSLYGEQLNNFFRALFRWSHAVFLTLLHENSDLLSKTAKCWKWSCSLCFYKHEASSCNSHHHIPDTDLIRKPDFLFETIIQLIIRWQKTQKYFEKHF